MTTVVLEMDLATGKREALFSLVLMAEPRWKNFQTRDPRLLYSMDDHGTTYNAKELGKERSSNWTDAGSNVVEFNREWNRVSLPISGDSAILTRLTVEIPIRLVKSRKMVRFEGLKKGSEAITKKVDATDFTIRNFAYTDRRASVSLVMTGDQAGDWGTYHFHLEKGGKQIGKFYARSAMQSEETIEFGLECFVREPMGGKGALDLVVTYPGETMEKPVEFTFKDIRLP
jgi:hypothetical protein